MTQRKVSRGRVINTENHIGGGSGVDKEKAGQNADSVQSIEYQRRQRQRKSSGDAGCLFNV